MHEYELALVVSSRIEEEARLSVVEKAKGYIERFGGEIGEIEEWGRQRLAYEIQKMTEGYYYFIPFTSGPDTPNLLEKEMRILENVLRYLVVRTDGEDEFHRTFDPAEEAAEEAAEAPAEAPAEAVEAPVQAAEEAAEAATEEVKEEAEAAAEAVAETVAEEAPAEAEAVAEAVPEEAEAVAEEATEDTAE